MDFQFFSIWPDGQSAYLEGAILSETLNGILVGFMSGLFSAILIEEARFRHSSKIERMKRVFPVLSPVHPLIDKITEDVRHAIKVQTRNEHTVFLTILAQIFASFSNYKNWFEDFRQKGLIPELESLNSRLAGHINGLYSYAVIINDAEENTRALYIQQKLEEIENYCDECQEILTLQLKE
jgi:hypothetical protein